MYQQYRKTNGNICELIDISGRFDEENQKIIAHYTNAKMTYNDILKTYIFPNWEDGDILFINNFSIVKPIFDSDKNIIREMTREEVCESGDLSVLDIGEVYQDGAIIKKEKPQGVKIEWIYPNWIETASDSEIYIYDLKSEYSEYKKIDTPSIIREMELLDSSLVDEYVFMMIELRELISKYNMGISTISNIPTPSKALVDFKNRIKNIL